MKQGRQRARADALQILYQLDMNQRLNVEGGVEHFKACFSEGRVVDAFVERLVGGVSENLKQLDEWLSSYSDNWRTDRMPAVDRNILRLGAFELYHCDDIPATVTINEMVELAKEFGSEGSSAFVNGVLDKFKAAFHRPDKAP